MGNKLVGRRRQVVDEKYTRPQGLYQHKDIDHKKLRKLILDSELAPCYPGHEENGVDLEECPICFLYYPSLNRSRCCTKGICTECFLQMKTPNSSRPTQCPFCKTSNYAVEYRGLKTKEEKGLEQIEEQRVIEAKIRMRQQELQDEEERMMKRREINSSSSITGPTEAEYCSAAVAPSLASVIQSDVSVTGQESRAVKQPPCPRQNRDDDFDLDLEDLMVMEAIWLSIQENGRHRNPVSGDSVPSERYAAEDHSIPEVTSPHIGTSSSGGLACAIAALAEHQQIGVGSSSNYNENMSSYNTLPGCSRLTSRDESDTQIYPPNGSAIVVSPDRQLRLTRDPREWVHHTSEVTEVGTSYADSEGFEDTVKPLAVHLQDDTGSSFQPVQGPIVPESFEEQMMLAMAVSLAEARARTSPPGVAWH